MLRVDKIVARDRLQYLKWEIGIHAFVSLRKGPIEILESDVRSQDSHYLTR